MAGFGPAPGSGGSSGGGGSAFTRFQDRIRAGMNPGGAQMQDIFNALPPNIKSNGVQLDEFHWADPATGTVYELGTDTNGNPSFRMMSDSDSKRFLGSVGVSSGGGGGGGGSGARLASDDPRYWEMQDKELALEYDKLSSDEKIAAQQIEAQLIAAGMSRDAARQRALTDLIASRNQTAVGIANTSADVAKTIADYAANPRDAVAELMYRRQVGGSTPFGDLTNDNFGEYGKALAAKAHEIFQPVAEDLHKGRLYRDAIPLPEFFGDSTKQAIAGQVPPPVNPLAPYMANDPRSQEQFAADLAAWSAASGGTSAGAAGRGAPPPIDPGIRPPNTKDPADIKRYLGEAAGLLDTADPNASLKGPSGTVVGNTRFTSSDPTVTAAEQAERYRKSASQPRQTSPAELKAWQKKLEGLSGLAEGGTVQALDFDGLFEGRDKPGFSPSSAEGGLNLNIHERAAILGESGRLYGVLGERREDGSIRSEQLIVKPLPSEIEKDKKLKEAGKAIVESKKQTLAGFAGGGTVSSTPDDFMEALSNLLGSFGGGGGTGAYDSPLPSPRLLAGDPWNRLMDDPDLYDYAQSGYSALGISPANLASTVKKFTPTGVRGNIPRVSFG